MNQLTLLNLLQARSVDCRKAELSGQDKEAAWRQGMLPYQVRAVEAHDQEVEATAQRLRQEQ